MILFTIKLISSIRKAIAGRRYPSQLAWGVALGVLLGVIPHGNLLAVVLVLGVLMLQVNHAVVALVGIGLTFYAPRFDPEFDRLGRWFFDQPEAAKAMASAWQLPLVPWTDLNNTVVMGSFLIGLAAIVPTFLLTYPLFKRWALALDESVDEELVAAEEKVSRVKKQLQTSGPGESMTAIRLDSNHAPGRPHDSSTQSEREQDDSRITASSGRVYDVRRIDPAEPISGASIGPKPSEMVRTKVSIASEGVNEQTVASGNSASPAQPTSSPSTVLMNGMVASETNNSKVEVEAGASPADDQQKIDEALSYLLRQLRDSKDKDAA